MQGFVIL